MRKIYILLIIALTANGFAQSNIVATGGNAVAMDNASLSYSIGQIDYIPLNSASGSLNLGNQQPYEIYVLDIENPNDIIKYSLFPNPTTNQIELSLFEIDFSKMKYVLFDVNGKLLFENTISNETTVISMESLSASIYFLSVMDEKSNIIKSFKIIKK
ncbi:T9SS type A sorting domain-containing protein [Flavobacterium sp.]|uniref:T9SS type A sorting domain-containing protein n=1 Tax=Flavobacterium sp. TaxID=239 RepID=UPI002607C2AE|nr:T9SS type A sorting domain-containing protein [Flavobacterium sp.]